MPQLAGRSSDGYFQLQAQEVITSEEGCAKQFSTVERGWLLIPEVDFIISCMAVMNFLREQSSQELALPFLEGRRRALPWQTSPEIQEKGRGVDRVTQSAPGRMNPPDRPGLIFPLSLSYQLLLATHGQPSVSKAQLQSHQTRPRVHPHLGFIPPL